MQSNQGFYKYKNTTYPKIFDNGYTTGTTVKLHDNREGYSYIISSAGDMIKSIGKNLIDASDVNYHYSSSTYKIDVTNDSNGTITVDTYGTYKTTNSQVFPTYMVVKIDKPCTIVFRIDHISGTYLKKDKGDTPTGFGHQCLVCDIDGNTLRSSYSTVSGPADTGVKYSKLVVTEDDIEGGANAVKLRLWANGTTDGGAGFDKLKYNIMAIITDGDMPEFEFEPYKESSKVCDNHGHCYCMTYVDGTVCSENGYEISVDYPKSLFAMKFRSITNRVQNIDGADSGNENQKILFFGDSITAGVGANQLYHMWLSRYTGWKCLNWGIGGDGYVKNHTGTGPSGEGVEGRGNMSAPHDTDNNIISMMQSVGDFDNCFIFAGTNDYGASIDIDVFRTAVQNTLDYAQTKANKIMVLTPVRRTNFDNPNSAGHKLHEYSGIILEECISRGITCVDGFDIAMNSNNAKSKSWYYSEADGLHPSDNGHKFIAMSVLEKFKAVFSV